MTKEELVGALAASAGVPVNEESYSSVMPYLICDVMYNLFVHDVQSRDFNQNLRRQGKNWTAHYKLFNDGLFGLFPEERHSEITDLMDTLNIDNDITMLRSKITLVLDNVPFEDKRTISALLACYCLSYYAQIVWGEAYKMPRKMKFGVLRIPTTNQHLTALKNISFNMAIALMKSIKGGEIRLSDLNADSEFQLIANHVRLWINQN